MPPNPKDSLERIGKSLLKYFKPIRTTRAHVKHKKIPPPGVSALDLELEDRKKKEASLVVVKPQIRGEDENSHAIDLKPDKPLQNWLDLVVFLLKACKHSTQKMKKKLAFKAYRQGQTSKGSTKIKHVGSIIDATPEIICDEDDENKAA